MAGRKKGFVRESAEQLKELAARHRNGKQRRIIDMLLLTLENPNATAESVGAALGCNEKTVRRWWNSYWRDGLDGMLGLDQAKNAAPIPCPTEPANGILPLFDSALVRFLNDLPVCTPTPQWIESFTLGLRRLFTDIDRVTVNVNIYYDLSDPHYQPSSFMVVEHTKDGKRTVSTRARQKTAGEHLLEEARKLKFPFHEYHPPQVFDFQIAGGQATIGTIILWREIWRCPISARTLTAIEALRPFIAFLLSDCVARRQRESKDLRFFAQVINKVAENDGLTRREQEALLHHLFGSNYQKIAAEMSITVDTVRKHVKSIHTKTGTHSIAELFARYLSPLSEL